MRELGIDDLGGVAKRRGLDAVMLETALLRLGKDFLKKGRRVDVKVVRKRRARYESRTRAIAARLGSSNGHGGLHLTDFLSG